MTSFFESVHCFGIRRKRQSECATKSNSTSHSCAETGKRTFRGRRDGFGLGIGRRSKMKQIGGKSIWTLPFKRKYTGSTANGGKPQLAVTGRINISSIIKYIKSLRKHKTRRILFAEVESNEFVHQNSYNVLSSQLRAGGRAGVIDFEKQCGILIYMVSSYFLAPAHSLSHHLKKYFDGHKARAPTTKIFGIIVLKMEVYNQVKRKASKSYMLTQKYPKPPKPAAPPTPNERPPLPPNAPPPNGSGSISGPPGKPRPPLFREVHHHHHRMEREMK